MSLFLALSLLLPSLFCPCSLHQIEVRLLCAASSEGRGGGGGERAL